MSLIWRLFMKKNVVSYLIAMGICAAISNLSLAADVGAKYVGTVTGDYSGSTCAMKILDVNDGVVTVRFFYESPYSKEAEILDLAYNRSQDAQAWETHEPVDKSLQGVKETDTINHVVILDEKSVPTSFEINKVIDVVYPPGSIDRVQITPVDVVTCTDLKRVN